MAQSSAQTSHAGPDAALPVSEQVGVEAVLAEPHCIARLGSRLQWTTCLLWHRAGCRPATGCQVVTVVWQEYRQLPARFTKQLPLEVLNQALAAFATIIAAKASSDSPSAGEPCQQLQSLADCGTPMSCRLKHHLVQGSACTVQPFHSKPKPPSRGCQPAITTLSPFLTPALWPACHWPRGPADMLRACRGDCGGLGIPAAGPVPHDSPHQCAAAPAAPTLVRDRGQSLLPAGQPCLTGCVPELHAGFVRHLRHGAMIAADPQDFDALPAKQARALAPMTPFSEQHREQPCCGQDPARLTGQWPASCPAMHGLKRQEGHSIAHDQAPDQDQVYAQHNCGTSPASSSDKQAPLQQEHHKSGKATPNSPAVRSADSMHEA